MAQLREDEWPETNEPTLAEKEEALAEGAPEYPSRSAELRMRGERDRVSRMDHTEIPEAPWKSDR